MSLDELVRDRRAGADARLGFAVVGACVASYSVFVVLPTLTSLSWLPAGLDGVWALAGFLTLLLAPVAAGLSAYASVVALWMHGDTLPTTARRLHLVTLLLVAALSSWLVSAWGVDAVSWWTE